MLHVAAAVIVGESGKILIAQRPRHLHQGGLWEFPGGKLEPGEDAEQALHRELREELGITVQQGRPLIRIRHRYPEHKVLLDVWRVTGYRGEPGGREGQALRWVAPEQLPDYPVPAANRAVVAAARLPGRCLVTPEPPADAAKFLSRLEQSLKRGIRLIQLRAKGVDERSYRSLARRVAALAHGHGARVLLNADPRLAVELGADGVHLTSRRLLSLQQRPLPRSSWVAASCHDERELEHAARIGVDFALLGPVRPTASHPDARVLGWERFFRLVEEARLPVFALGGVGEEQLERARSCGAQGIAAIRAFWRD